MANAMQLMWVIMMGLVAFMAWLYIYDPVVNDILFPFLDCSAIAIPNAAVIKAFISFFPLFTIIMIFMIPLFQTTD